MHQRIVQLVEHGLIELRLAAFECQLDFLMQAAAQVVDQALEALKSRPQRQGAHAHRGLAKLRGQGFNLFRHSLHGAIFAAGGKLCQPGLHSHQLADQIDQLVEFGGSHANAGGLRFLVGGTAALAGRLYDGRRGCSCAVRRRTDLLDGQFATALHENEDIADLVGSHGSGQNHVPGDVAALGIQFTDSRDGRSIRLDLKRSQMAQFAQQQQRIGPGSQQIGSRTKTDVPFTGCARSDWRARGYCGWPRLDRRLGGSGQRPQFLEDVRRRLGAPVALSGAFIQHDLDLIDCSQGEAD